MGTAKETFPQAAFPTNFVTFHHRTQLEPMPDDESTEADEPGAFASLLSGLSSEGECLDAIEWKLDAADAAAPVVGAAMSSEDSEPSDPDKSVMVCRHWRSKGWCRMEGDCKFLHPEHKRGVNAPK